MTRAPTSVSQAAQLQAAQAQLRQAQINLDYTEIRAPVGGKIGRTRFTVGNVVSPELRAAGHDRQPGPDVCRVPDRRRAPRSSCENRYADRGGVNAVVVQAAAAGRQHLRPGRQDRLHRADRRGQHRHDPAARAASPTRNARRAIGPARRRPRADRRRVRHRAGRGRRAGAWRSPCPRAAVLSDQQGNYVYVVDARTRRSSAASSSASPRPTTAVVVSGLKEGEMVVVDGIQRVRPAAGHAGPAIPARLAPRRRPRTQRRPRRATSPPAAPAGGAVRQHGGPPEPRGH